MAWISFGALPYRKKENLMTARVSLLLKSHASLTFFRAYFLPGRAKDLSAPRYRFEMSSSFSLCLLLQEGSSSVEFRQSTSLYVTHLNSTSKSLCLQIALIPWTKGQIWLLENWFVLLFLIFHDYGNSLATLNARLLRLVVQQPMSRKFRDWIITDKPAISGQFCCHGW